MRSGLLQKASLLLSATVVAMSAATAAELSPSQALARACQSLPAQSPLTKRLGHGAAIDQLRFTQTDSLGQAAVYVFAAEAGNPGFILAAADDRVPAVLGYSDDTTFDPSNIPPAMQWWLSEYAAQIACLTDGPITVTGPVTETSARPKSVKLAVSPICKTLWDQSTPFNNDCPVGSGGTNCVTGCVATAQAQVMKVHNWPTATSEEATFTYTVDNVSTTATIALGGYDWDNMLDDYSGAYTETQAAAVAKLMYQCGAACQMSYTESSSGAVTLYAAQNFRKYFNYDKGTTYYERCWFTTDEWNDLIYAEMAAGRAVMYNGQSNTSGHAFVCDGYSYDDYFHINWGWGGSSNGYFLLTALDPPTQGIGGSTSGYNSSQGATVGIQKPQDDTVEKYVFEAENLYSDASTYNAKSGSITLGYGFWNRSLAQTASITIGVMCEQEDGTLLKTIGYTNYDFTINLGFYNMIFSTSKFPTGTYRVYPAYTDVDGSWRHMYHPLDRPGYLIFTNDGTTITVTDSNGATPSALTATATLQSIVDPSTSASASTIYTAQTYNFNWQLTTNKPYDGKVKMKFGKYSSSFTIYAFSDPVEVEIADVEGGTGSVTVPFAIPSSISAGTWYVMLSYDAGDSYTNCNSIYSFTVTKASNTGTAVATGFTTGTTSISVDSSNPTTVSLNNPNLALTLQSSEGSWVDTVRLNVYKLTSDGYTYAGALSLGSVTIASGQSVTLTFDTSLVGVFDTSSTYFLIPYASSAGQLKVVQGSMTDYYWYYVKFTETPEVAVAGIEFDNKISEGLYAYDPAYVYINDPNIRVILYGVASTWVSDMYGVVAELDGTIVGTSATTTDVTVPEGENKIVYIDAFTPVSGSGSSSALRPKEIKTSSTIYQFYPYASTYGTALDAVRYVIFTPTTGVDGVGVDSQGVVGIFPNPADDVVNVTGIAGRATVEIYSLAGSLVKSVAIDGATTIDVSGLAAGQYVVRIATDGGVTTHKLIKR